jgi:hypothetical protein
MFSNKERENHEMRDRLNKNLDKSSNGDLNYSELRENNDRVVVSNQQLKDDIVEL